MSGMGGRSGGGGGMSSRGSGGMGGRGTMFGERQVARVDRIVRAPGGGHRRVDVTLKENRDGWEKEKASVYLKNKDARALEKGKSYEFNLERRVYDKERGQGEGRGGSFGKSRTTYWSEGTPDAVTSVDKRMGRFSDTKNGKHTSKWFHS